MFERTILQNGTTRLAHERCTFEFARLRPGALLITITGDDTGQFGSAAFDEIADEFSRFGRPVRLFFDATKAAGPASVVMKDWTAWFAANRPRLDRVLVLVDPDAKLTHLTVSIAQHLSRTGSLIRVTTDAASFAAEVAKERGGRVQSPGGESTAAPFPN